MILPNKLFSYNDSILSKMPCILYNLNTPKTPVELLHLCRAIKGPVELVDVLDCIYALKKITLNEKGEIEKC